MAPPKPDPESIKEIMDATADMLKTSLETMMNKFADTDLGFGLSHIGLFQRFTLSDMLGVISMYTTTMQTLKSNFNIPLSLHWGK